MNILIFSLVYCNELDHVRSSFFMVFYPPNPRFIELDDGKNLTGKPDQFDGKLTHGFPVSRFSQQNQSIDKEFSRFVQNKTIDNYTIDDYTIYTIYTSSYFPNKTNPKSQIHCHFPQELLELDGLQPLEELRRAAASAASSSAPNVFAAVRRAVRQQQLVASVAESVARKALRSAEGQQLLLHLGAQGHLESF